jgi:hypothetical protein
MVAMSAADMPEPRPGRKGSAVKLLLALVPRVTVAMVKFS